MRASSGQQKRGDTKGAYQILSPKHFHRSCGLQVRIAPNPAAHCGEASVARDRTLS